jgi:hypothetical protein
VEKKLSAVLRTGEVDGEAVTNEWQRAGLHPDSGKQTKCAISIANTISHSMAEIDGKLAMHHKSVAKKVAGIRGDRGRLGNHD